MKWILFLVTGSLIFHSCVNPEEKRTDMPTLDEVISSGRDLWGEAAIAATDGPGYDHFSSLIPPLRYVNADFHYYPIVLSAPNAPVKARLISNGSGINLPGGTKSWRDVGFPFIFRVGTDEFLFGSLIDRLEEPKLAEEWLPVPEICYLHGTPFQSEGLVPLNQERKEQAQEIYRLEAFASTNPALSGNGVVFVSFDLKQGGKGYVAVDPGDSACIIFSNHILTSREGKVLAFFDHTWKFKNGLIRAEITQTDKATLAIATKPFELNLAPAFDADSYGKEREICIQTWKELIAKGTRIETPDTLVNHAYRSSLCQIYQMINGDEIRYSSGNQYDKMYEAEGSDAALALLLLGYEEEMKRLMVPLFEFTRKNLELHHASFKINNLCQYYWFTRNRQIIQDFRRYWEPEITRLDTGRTGPGGLYPPEQYCGDIHTFVQSLNVNAKAWRAMRDLGALLTETGYTEEGEHYARQSEDFRKVVLAAIQKVADSSTSPPFIPVALSGGEPVHDPILHSRIGSYWNIIIGYTVMSGIFPPGSEEQDWIPEYQEQHGGLCMGMLRSGGGKFNFWTGDQRINPLYGTRYSLNTLFRDNPERALVSFYGMLAQGMTRNTFVGGEGASLYPVDVNGRFFYCPPNSAANAHFLSMLRNILVQDWDMDDDGKPETLRLGFATSKRWLTKGRNIVVKNAPTAFGNVSYQIVPDLQAGTVKCHYEPPPRKPERCLLRIRVPDAWKIASATALGQKLEVDESGTVDVSGFSEPADIHFNIARR